VVGANDAEGLEKPVAGVVRTEGSKLAADEILEFCREGLPAFKRPRAVLFLDAVPTTATGKVQRFVVREVAKDVLTAR
jgi:acyl-CoA synthetase (AMP-forming)/AMP-acid ligase II